MILTILLSFILLCLGLIHFYWAVGGEFGFAATLPTYESGKRVLNPKKIHSAIVGFGLTAFSVFYLLQTGFIDFRFPDWLFKYGGWLIPILFLLRAIGDFNFVGFFKTVKTTDFGKLDTKFYSPLCLFIGVVGLSIQLMK